MLSDTCQRLLCRRLSTDTTGVSLDVDSGAQNPDGHAISDQVMLPTLSVVLCRKNLF